MVYTQLIFVHWRLLYGRPMLLALLLWFSRSTGLRWQCTRLCVYTDIIHCCNSNFVEMLCSTIVNTFFFDIYRLLFSLTSGVLLLHLCFYCSLSFILSHFLLAYSVDIVCTFRYSLSDSSCAFANDFMCVLMASVVCRLLMTVFLSLSCDSSTDLTSNFQNIFFGDIPGGFCQNCRGCDSE